MKKVFTLLVGLVCTIGVFSQAPPKMSYQAVIRNSSDQLVINQAIGLRISILQGGVTGTPVYVETQTTTTNANGLITIEIGGGTELTGIFSTIDWSSGVYFIKTETDIMGGTNYTITGTNQMLSVPYSFYSKIAGTSTDAVKLTGDQIIDGNKIFIGTINSTLHNNTNVADPVNAQDAATKAYVDALFETVKQLQADLGTKDIDGNTYKAIKIGSQVWMAENLKTTKFNDGTEIPLVTNNTEWSNLTTPAYCWYNNDETTNKNLYGALYDRQAVSTGKLCPAGWHVPSDAEWHQLILFLDPNAVLSDPQSLIAGGKLKEVGTAHWMSPNTGATNETGFTGLPAGYRNSNGLFNTWAIGILSYWWTASSEGGIRYLLNDRSDFSIASTMLPWGCSVRCLFGTIPTVTTVMVTTFTSNSAYVGGNVSSDGNVAVSERGVFWGTSHNPEINGSKLPIGRGIGSFMTNLSGLDPNTTYYLKSYAVNEVSISYGNETSFKTAMNEVPTFTTTPVSFIAINSASSGGTVKCDGGVVTVRGVCWSTSVNPTISDRITKDGEGSGTFTSLITGLIAGTKYYVRAYATNILGTFYGNQVDFTTQNYGTVIDFDGNMYKTLIIGTQTWMAENLKTTKYNDGSIIQLLTSSSSTPGYYSYNNFSTLKNIYGVLYNWYSCDASNNGGKNVCPTGWHVPSDVEWSTLMTYLGGESVAGGKLKENGISHWANPNNYSTNESGFTALPGGLVSQGTFMGVGEAGFWWSSTERNSENSLGMRITRNNSYCNSIEERKTQGFSVRCIKNN
jgi:uncharacterized protein (TIGR02145 family)